MRRSASTCIALCFSLLVGSSLMAEEFKERLLSKAHSTPICSVSFSADGNRLATCAEGDDNVIVYDLQAGKRLARINLGGPARFATLSPDGQVLACTKSELPARSLTVIDVASGKTLATPVLWAFASQVLFASDGATLVTLNLRRSVRRCVRLWSLPSGEERVVLPAQNLGYVPICLSGDGKLLAFPDGDRVRLVEMATGVEQKALEGRGRTVQRLAFSPDGRLLATAAEGEATVRVWDLAKGRERAALTWSGQSDVGDIRVLVYSPDARMLATAHGSGQLKLWEVASGKERAEMGTGKLVSGLVFSATGRAVTATRRYIPPDLGTALGALGGEAGEVKVWDLDTLKVRATLQPKDGTEFALLSDGSRLAWGFKDGSVKVWELGPGTKK